MFFIESIVIDLPAPRHVMQTISFFICSPSLRVNVILPGDLESIDLISCLMDNIDLYPSLNLWISFDPNLFIKVKEDNYENLIKYIANRYSI